MDSLSLLLGLGLLAGLPLRDLGVHLFSKLTGCPGPGIPTGDVRLRLFVRLAMIFEPFHQFVEPCPLLGGVVLQATLLIDERMNESLHLAFAILHEV